MEITTSCLCSNSPTTASHTSLISDIDSIPRITSSQHSSSKRGAGGLSAVFAARNVNDLLDFSCSSNSAGRVVQQSSCSPWQSFESWQEASSLGLSPVSVLHGSDAYISTPTCIQEQSNEVGLLDQQTGSPVLLSSLWLDAYRPLSSGLDHGAAFGPGLGEDEPWSDLEDELLDPYAKKPAYIYPTDNALLDAQNQHEMFNEPFVVEAFREAKKACLAQFDGTVGFTFHQCVETGLTLAAVGASEAVVAAGLLHGVWSGEFEAMFGEKVTKLVKGVSRVNELSKMARENNIVSDTVGAEQMRTMILAVEGAFVILIKLADRLTRMRTLSMLPEPEQWQIARETLHIFTPLANRLGLWTWKTELEDLCFKHLMPREYEDLAKKLAGRFADNTIKDSIQKLEDSLLEEGILCHELRGRQKNPFGIHRKMLRKHRTLEEVNDVRGLRLIVSSNDDCYSVLHVVHKLWQQVPESIKDYIVQPKTNGYQSLHTTVYADDGLPLEVQIRTKEMHYQAEFGGAAHWRYKEDDVKHSPYILRLVECARWTLAQQSEIMELKPLSEFSLRSACSILHQKEECLHPEFEQIIPAERDDPLFIFVMQDNKGMIKELPHGSTLADLLHACFMDAEMAFGKVRVNCQVIDSVHQVLNMGDQIELAHRVLDGPLIEYERERIKRMFHETTGGGAKHTAQSF